MPLEALESWYELAVHNCPECERLRRECADAITEHVQKENRLQLAALQFEHEKVLQLTPMVEEAAKKRAQSREAIAEHKRTAHGRAEAAEAK